ncbi:MAG: 50S ribosomal protein L1 [Gammaproteobacteria bacterium]
MKANTQKIPSNLSKRNKAIREKLVPGKLYPFSDAVALLKSFPALKFVESVDVAINLGVDPKKSDQVVRSSTVLPHGTGKSVRVAVFTQGANAEAAKAAGADRVGMDDLAQEMQAGQMDYDVVIASPDAMGIVGRLGPVLGPRGLMPNPKVGTVSPDVAQAVRNAKGGQVRYRTDKNGILHCTIGKINFEAQALQENLSALLNDVRKVKPSSSKGVYLRKITLSTTMGPGLVVELAGL